MKTLRQLIALSLLCVTTTFASTSQTTINNEYSALSTLELEKQVEKLSNTGELPFEMGLELMKRWKRI